MIAIWWQYICWPWFLVRFSALKFLGNIKLPFSEKSVVWSNGTEVFDLPMEFASCLKLPISNFIIVFLVSSSSQRLLLPFTCSLCTCFVVFMSRYCFVPRKFHSLERVWIHIIQLLTRRMILKKNLKKKLLV